MNYPFVNLNMQSANIDIRNNIRLHAINFHNYLPNLSRSNNIYSVKDNLLTEPIQNQEYTNTVSYFLMRNYRSFMIFISFQIQLLWSVMMYMERP